MSKKLPLIPFYLLTDDSTETIGMREAQVGLLGRHNHVQSYKVIDSFSDV